MDNFTNKKLIIHKKTIIEWDKKLDYSVGKEVKKVAYRELKFRMWSRERQGNSLIFIIFLSSAT